MSDHVYKIVELVGTSTAFRQALRLVTGKEYRELKSLRPEIKLAPPNPENMDFWVDLAEKQSYTVLAQQAATEVAALEQRRLREWARSASRYAENDQRIEKTVGMVGHDEHRSTREWAAHLLEPVEYARRPTHQPGDEVARVHSFAFGKHDSP